MQDIIDHELSALAAARVLRALVACPGAAFSETALVCYYWIAREMYTAEESDWNTGGVRAAVEEGFASAFVTGECVHALLSFAEAQEKTAAFIEEAGKFIERKEHLKQLAKACGGLADWIKIEKERLDLSFLLTYRRLSRHLVLQKDVLLPDPDKLDDYFATEFPKALYEAIIQARKNFGGAKKQIIGYRGKEKNKNQERTFKKSESAHSIALSAVEAALKRAEEVEVFQNNTNKKKEEKFKKCQTELKKAAKEVQDFLRPAMNYLGSVLDRELSSVSLGELDWQSAELAFAASAYGRLRHSPGDWEKDPCFGRATEHLSRAVSHSGLMPNKRPYHIKRTPANIRYYCSNSAALTAVVQLLRNLKTPDIEPDFIENVLFFFEETRADQAYKDWRFSKDELGNIVAVEEKEDDSNKIREKQSEQLEIGYPILKYLRKKPELTANLTLNALLPLPQNNTNARKYNEAIREVVAEELNKILEDDQFLTLLKDKQFHTLLANNNSQTTVVEFVEKAEKASAEKDGHERVRCNRVLMELAYQGIILKSGAEKFSSDKKGWCREHSPFPRKTNLTATAHAVFALAEIHEMLDERINRMILEHFTVKKKDKELSPAVTLDTVFYPDYGLCSDFLKDEDFGKKCPDHIEKKDWPEKGIKRENSVAITLLQMHAHVSRAFLPNNYSPLSSLSPLCSLVLHGPAGTSKTTLVEALAVTCDVPMVEVTPSDLVKRGEENIEQRARAVFEALSMLSRAVILFDEFDPVLKRRDVGNNNPLSVFSFLTPGMLPKLKDLHNQAEKRSVAYVLVTNLIGELDEAAVRQGRFDKRLGIFPPDLLSRAGRFLDQFSEQINLNCKKCAASELYGITVLSAFGFKSENISGKFLFSDESADRLVFKLSDGTELVATNISTDGVYELQAKNKDDSTVLLYVSIDRDKLSRLFGDLPKEDLIIAENVPWDRIVEIIRDTAGKGMTTLGKPGWFTRLKEGKKLKAETPIGFVLGMAEKFEEPEPDDELKGIRGEGRTAVKECLQWMWIKAWDDKLSEEAATDKELYKALNELASLNKLASPEYAQTSRDQWEVLEDGNIERPKWFIRRSKHGPDKK